MKSIVQFIKDMNLEIICIAITLNIWTEAFKFPLKVWIARHKKWQFFLKYLPFMPIILGFFITYIFKNLFYGETILNDFFITTWISSSSLSLAMYAILEKICFTNQKMKEKLELEKIKNLLEEIRVILLNRQNNLKEIPKDPINQQKLYTKEKKL